MNASTTLEQRLAQVEAVQAIHALKARYAALADQKYTVARERVDEQRMREVARLQAECFTDDAVWDGGSDFGDRLVGRARLTEWFTRSPWCFALHYYGSPELAVSGDTATGRWRLWQLALRGGDRQAVLLAAVTEEAYARQADGRWLHSRMRFSQIHLLPIAAPLLSQLPALSPSPQP
ncbi:MAG TPA: nuclear transport factor 2 family protein [Ramlibacter sp.]|nr:nuclear transport factor 2 family protein [Ramlibacter sp.]